jgi:putative DNA primase/helicase
MTRDNLSTLEVETFLKRLDQGILSELLPFRQWVIWRYQFVKGQWKKQPYNPVNGRAAKTNDRNTWGTFAQAIYRLETGQYHGIGFVFSDDDPFCGTDLDNAVSEDGTIAEWAQPYIDALNSYTEYSPSRKGLHILTKAHLPGPGKKAGRVEMYAMTHYFTITGDHVPGTPLTINERQATQTMLYETLAASYSPERTENTGVGVRPRAGLKRSDAEIIQKARVAKNGAVFTRLWNGDTSGYATKSEADFALVLLLLYWTDDDLARADRFYRQSGLFDEKWDRPLGEYTYGQVTIHNALKKRSMRSF